MVEHDVILAKLATIERVHDVLRHLDDLHRFGAAVLARFAPAP